MSMRSYTLHLYARQVTGLGVPLGNSNFKGTCRYMHVFVNLKVTIYDKYGPYIGLCGPYALREMYFTTFGGIYCVPLFSREIISEEFLNQMYVATE